MMFPAGAGMNRIVGPGRYRSTNVPRRRGDEPKYPLLLRTLTQCSPQARG